MTAAVRFDGLTAIVTGAGRGLGAAHARLLATRGANVVLNDVVDIDRGLLPNAAIAVTGSITERRTAADLVAAAVDTFGGVDIVINNAGIARPAPIDRLDEAALRDELDVHLVGALLLVQAAWPHLEASGRGAVVSTTSGVGLFGLRGALGYAAAKAAIVGATRALAQEGQRNAVRVNAVAPIAQTDMAGGVFGVLAEHLDPALVSAVVAWLAHPTCPLTGAVVSAGGGRVALVRTTVGRGHPAATLDDMPALDLGADEFVELDHALAETDLIRALIEEGGRPASEKGAVPPPA